MYVRVCVGGGGVCACECVCMCERVDERMRVNCAFDNFRLLTKNRKISVENYKMSFLGFVLKK